MLNEAKQSLKLKLKNPNLLEDTVVTYGFVYNDSIALIEFKGPEKWEVEFKDENFFASHKGSFENCLEFFIEQCNA